MKRVFRGVLSCPRLRGKSGVAGLGEASAASQLPECVSCHMTYKANPVTLTLYSSPKGRYHNPQRRRRCRPLSASEHNPPPTGGHNPRGEAPSTDPSEPFEPSEPSRRRRVHRACPQKISFLFLPKSLKAPAMKRRGLSFPYRRWNREMPLSMMLHRTCVLCCF
jgi:hypothetical protein